MRILKERGKLTLNAVLIRSTLLPTVLPGFLIFILSCVMCFRLAVSQGQSYGREMVVTASAYVGSRIDIAETLADALPSLNGRTGKYSPDSLYMLIRRSGSPGMTPFPLTYYEHYMRISQLIGQNYLSTNEDINGVYIITGEGRMFSFASKMALMPESDYPMEAYLQYTEGGYALIPAGLQRQFDVLSNKSDLQADSILTMVVPLRDTQNPIAVALIDMNSRLMEPIAAQSGVTYLLLNGQVIYSFGGALASFDPAAEKTGARYDLLRQAVIAREDISDTYGLSLVLVRPYSLLRWLMTTLPACIAITLISMVLSVRLMRRRAARLSKPVTDLAEAMNSSRPLTAEAVHYQGIEEFETLYRQYNDMRLQINSYIEKVYAEELAATRMRLEALSAQIDNHFLYNTFECMYSMSLLRGVDDVAQMTKSLSDMFHYISDSEPVVRVAQEVRHICDYRTIQSMRFQGKFDMLIDMDEAVLPLHIPRLILQPLVENAYKHGVRQRTGGRITVSGTLLDGVMRFVVEDDGVGMTSERLMQVRRAVDEAIVGREPESGDCVGITNIAMRLYLYDKRSAGVIIHSDLGAGTRVELVLSAKERHNA